MHRWWLRLRRRWPLWLVIAGALAFGVSHLNQVGEVARTLLYGQWQWVLVAVLLQMVCFILYAALYRFGFHAVEVESRWGDLVPVLFASICLKMMVPSGGVSGVALFVDDAARRGQSSARAAQGALLVLAADLITMAPLLVYGLLYLLSRGALKPYQAMGAAAFLAFAACLATMLLLGLWQPHLLHGLLNGLQAAANGVASWLGRPAPLAEDWAATNAAEFLGAATGIANHPTRLGPTLGLALAIHLIDVLGLYAIFLAYHQPVGLGALTVGFAMDVVFSVVSFIPHGIGVAEGVITLALASLGVPMAKALVVALVARGLNIWLPFVVGFAFLHQVPAFGAQRLD